MGGNFSAEEGIRAAVTGMEALKGSEVMCTGGAIGEGGCAGI